MSTRRRLLLWIFGSVIIVLIAGNFLAVNLVKTRLIDQIDHNLSDDTPPIVGIIAPLDESQLADINTSDDTPGRSTAIALRSRDGDIPLLLQSGAAAEPDPPPDVEGSSFDELWLRQGSPFRLDAIDSDLDYRALVTRLDNDTLLVLAAPLDGVEATLDQLIFTLILTTTGVVVVLGAIIWVALRQSLEPYHDMIDTADAIANGDLDRRANAASADTDLGRLAHALNDMLDQIQTSFSAREESEARLTRFVADASHDLRTPLTSIQGYADLYLTGAAQEQADIDKAMTRIHGEAARMNELVEDMLTLARFDHGQPLTLEEVDLAKITAEMVDDSRAVEPNREIELTGTNRQALVIGDEARLRQLVANLLSNIRDHTPADTRAEVDLRIDDTDHVVLAVADNGPGMSPEAASSAFERFYRAEPSRTRSHPGSGLGLAIVDEIAGAHGGAAHITSTTGAGTTVTIRLPLAHP